MGNNIAGLFGAIHLFEDDEPIHVPHRQEVKPFCGTPSISLRSYGSAQLNSEEGRVYSRFKHGDRESLAHYGAELSNAVRESLANSTGSQVNWKVASLQASLLLPGWLLASTLAENLGVHHLNVIINADKQQMEIEQGSYAGLNKAMERNASVRGKYVIDDGTPWKGAHILYVDDVTVSGSTAAEVQRLATLAGAASFQSAFIGELARGVPYKVEALLNQCGLGPDREQALADLLLQGAHLTTRLVASIMTSPASEFLHFLSLIDHASAGRLAEAVSAWIGPTRSITVQANRLALADLCSRPASHLQRARGANRIEDNETHDRLGG